jgi:hypothetical protein
LTWHYAPPLEEFQFVLEELLDIRRQWSDIPAFADLGGDAIAPILEAAGRFVVEKLAPVNAAGDAAGCLYRDGSVATPAGRRWPVMRATAVRVCHNS